MTANGSNGDRLVLGKVWGRKIGKKKLVFNTAGATTGTDQFYLLAISDSTAAPHPSLGGYIRYNYVDG